MNPDLPDPAQPTAPAEPDPAGVGPGGGTRPNPRTAGGSPDVAPDAAAEAPGEPHPVPEGSELRAGLPEVVLEAVSELDSQASADAQRASTGGDPISGSTSASRE